jgi:signal recognition particle receptor subunit beta
MVQFNFSERTIKAKVVYYGPAQSGKTTNLEQVHVLTDPAGSNRLVSLNTAQDRTLFFDLLPFSLGTVSGYDFQVQLYTVPGQVQYNATRRVVLAGADAVVFVADSRKAMAKENLAAFENMKVNLLANRLVPEKVPIVLQWNKRDLPDLQTEAEMNKALNPWARPSFPAVAAKGQGVLETFIAVVQQMLTAIAIKYNLKEKGLDPASVPELVDAAFKNLLKQAAAAAPAAATAGPAGAGAAPAPAKVVLKQAPSDPSQGAPLQASPDTGLVAEELLSRSIKSNVEMAEALSGLVRQMNQGLGTILSQAELLKIYRDDQRDKRLEAANAIFGEATRLRTILQNMGQTAAGAPGSLPPSRPAAQTITGRPTAPPRPAAAAAPAGGPMLDGTLREALAQVQSALDARGVSVDVRVPSGTALPRVPPDQVRRAVAALLSGVSATSAAGSTTMLRCERKPVLLRGRNGEEMKRDFLMLALAHGAVLTPEAQQRILQGADTGPLGEAWRLVREMGGFVRFAPLAAGGLETRLFLPAS